MKRRRRGVTLVEILVAMTLFSMATGMALDLLKPALSIFHLDQTQARLDETSLILGRKMQSELLASRLDSVTVSTHAIAFLSGSSFDPSTGRPIWEEFVIYYLDNGNVCRKTYQPTGLPSTKTLRLTNTQLTQALMTPNGSEAILSQNAQSF
ncbi:unnamed protein product, partial [Phaeothamnion confervicola]